MNVRKQTFIHNILFVEQSRLNFDDDILYPFNKNQNRIKNKLNQDN